MWEPPPGRAHSAGEGRQAMAAAFRAISSGTTVGARGQAGCVSQRSKLFREWEEIGLGTAVLLQSPSQLRFVLGQDTTMKIVCYFIVTGAPRYCALKPRAGNDKAWVREVLDCSYEEPKALQCASKFATNEHALNFKDKFKEAASTTWQR